MTAVAPTGRAAPRLQAALVGGVAEQRALVAAVELVLAPPHAVGVERATILCDYSQSCHNDF